MISNNLVNAKLYISLLSLDMGINIPRTTKKNLDNLDITIITELQKDASITYNELSKILNVSESTIYDRTRRLKERGVIVRIVPLLDAKKCGKLTTAWIRISINNMQEIGRISKELAMIDELLEVCEISGEWDILVKTKVKDNEELRNIEVNKIGNIQGIVGLYSIIAVRTEKEDVRLNISNNLLV